MYDTANLSSNMKKYRKALGLTQTELAKKLFISTQSISKWETGLSFPDIKNLCMLASALCVTTDDLLRSNIRSDKNAMIAIDGGGTKTEFILFYETGEILGRIVLKGSNPNTYGIENATATLREGIDSLLRICPTVTAIYAGIAGCGIAENREAVLSFLRTQYTQIPFIKVQTDIINVIYTAENTENCIAAVSGTGCAVYVKIGESLRRLGGWGYLFDRGGSAYDIGRDGLVAALAERDGLGEKTAITALIEKSLGASVIDKIPTFYSRGNEYIASFAKYVFEAYETGDTVAAKIIQATADRIAALINHAIKSCGANGNTLLAGGMIEAQADVLLPLIKAKLNKKATVSLSAMPQILGAAVCCTKAFAVYEQSMRGKLMLEYTKITEQEK